MTKISGYQELPKQGTHIQYNRQNTVSYAGQLMNYSYLNITSHYGADPNCEPAHFAPLRIFAPYSDRRRARGAAHKQRPRFSHPALTYFERLNNGSQSPLRSALLRQLISCSTCAQFP